MNFEDLQEEEIITKPTKKVVVEEIPLSKQKHSRLTPLTRGEKEYMFEEKLKEANKLKEDTKLKEDLSTCVKEEENTVITIKEKKDNCLIVIQDKTVEEEFIVKKDKDDNFVKEKIDRPYSSNQSLQDNFKSFMKKKKTEKIKTKNALDILKTCRILNPDEVFRNELRQKFINQAKKYFGVPYSKKFWKEGDEHFNSPLFLDCCGLIRRCVNDLSEDFKFTMFGWNQQYQYDILPDEIEYDQLKPGDLIFYSGTFFDKEKVIYLFSGNLNIMI